MVDGSATRHSAELVRCAQSVVAGRQRVEGWRQLIGLALDDGQQALALQLADEASLHLPRAAALNLLFDAGGLPHERCGRPFARLPDAQEGLLMAAPPAPRAQPSPDGSRFLVPTGTGWQVFPVGAGSPTLAPDQAAVATAATWLDDDRFAVGVGAHLSSLSRMPPHAGVTETRLYTAPAGRIVGLVGPLPGARLALSIAPERALSYDVLLLDLGSGTTRSVSNLSSTLDRAVARWDAGFVCVGEGLQPFEVRFVAGDGSWRTQTHHPSPVRGVAADGMGRVASFDRHGEVLIWEGYPPRAPRGGRLAMGGLDGVGVVQACLHPEGDVLLVVVEDEGQLWRAPVDGSISEKVDGIDGAPTSLGSDTRQVAFRSRHGWVWLDTDAMQLSPAWRLSALLATQDELSRCPFISTEARRRVEAFTDLARSSGVEPGRLDALRLQGATPWIRCSAPIVGRLALGSTGG